MEITEPLWRPSPERIERAHITAFLRWLERERGLTFADYESLWQWSVNDLEGFWGALWHFLDIRAVAALRACARMRARCPAPSGSSARG